MILLSLFGLGILIIDLVLPPEWKRWNAITALVGLGFAAAAGIRIQTATFTDGSRVLGSFGFLSGQGEKFVGAILWMLSRSTSSICFWSAQPSPYSCRSAIWKSSARTTASFTR